QGLAVGDLNDAGEIGVVDGGAGDGDVVQRQRLAGIDVDVAVVDLGVAVDGRAAGDVDDAAAGAVDGAVVDGAGIDGGGVQRQRHGVGDGDGAVVDHGALVDRAVADDVDGAGAGDAAVVDGAVVDGGARQRQGLAVGDLNDAGEIGVVDGGAGDGDVVQRQRLAGIDVDVAVVDLGVAVDGRAAGDVDDAAAGAVDGAVVDGAGIDGGARQRQGLAVGDLNDAGEIGVVDGGAGDGDVVQRQRLAGIDVDVAVVDLGVAVDGRAAGDVDDAAAGAVDGAVV